VQLQQQPQHCTPPDLVGIRPASLVLLQVYNFSAGPAILPLEVLEQAQRDCLNYSGSGMSVMEMSHRSKAFDGIIKAAEADLRQLLNIPDNYKVLFVQGGASTQFAAIPLNFTQEGALLFGNSLAGVARSSSQRALCASVTHRTFHGMQQD